MDPDETLARLRAASKAWTETDGEDLDYGDDMRDAFEALDEWLTKGGSLPNDWGDHWEIAE